MQDFDRARVYCERDCARHVLTVTVPTWRATKDISIRDDLVEEIGRMVGYEEITPAAPLVASVVPPSDPMRQYLRQIRAELVSQGFTEVYNYSFVNEEHAGRFLLEAKDHIAIKNPIASEFTHLRRSLLPGVFRNIVYNVRHFREFRLFEIGKEIHPSPGLTAPQRSHPWHWQLSTTRKVMSRISSS